MHQVVITPSARREVKKLPKKVRLTAFEISKKLEDSPYLGEKLSGSLYFIYSYHFKVDGKNYRFAYTIDSKNHLII